MGLRELMERVKCGWMVDSRWGPPEERIAHYEHLLEEIRRLERQDGQETLSPEWLDEVSASNDHRLAMLFQLLWCDTSPGICLALWRIACGWTLTAMCLSYQMGRDPVLAISLECDLRDGSEPRRMAVAGGSVGDLQALRHIGVMQIKDKVLLDGAYPLRLKDPPTCSSKLA